MGVEGRLGVDIKREQGVDEREDGSFRRRTREQAMNVSPLEIVRLRLCGCPGVRGGWS